MYVKTMRIEMEKRDCKSDFKASRDLDDGNAEDGSTLDERLVWLRTSDFRYLLYIYVYVHDASSKNKTEDIGLMYFPVNVSQLNDANPLASETVILTKRPTTQTTFAVIAVLSVLQYFMYLKMKNTANNLSNVINSIRR